MAYLEECLIHINDAYARSVIAMPLIASGLGANYEMKGLMSDKQYFKHFIAPLIEETLTDVNTIIYYL